MPVCKTPGDYCLEYPSTSLATYNCTALDYTLTAFYNWSSRKILQNNPIQLCVSGSTVTLHLTAGAASEQSDYYNCQCAGSASSGPESRWDAHLHLGGTEIAPPRTARLPPVPGGLEQDSH